MKTWKEYFLGKKESFVALSQEALPKTWPKPISEYAELDFTCGLICKYGGDSKLSDIFFRRALDLLDRAFTEGVLNKKGLYYPVDRGRASCLRVYSNFIMNGEWDYAQYDRAISDYYAHCFESDIDDFSSRDWLALLRMTVVCGDLEFAQKILEESQVMVNKDQFSLLRKIISCLTSEHDSSVEVSLAKYLNKIKAVNYKGYFGNPEPMRFEMAIIQAAYFDLGRDEWDSSQILDLISNG